MGTLSAVAVYDGYKDKTSDSIGESKGMHHILLIEDNKNDVMLIKHMLRGMPTQHAFAFRDVPRMSDALELLDRASFDLIVLDLNLLDIGGAASVAAVHASAPETPIIVHSGANDTKLKQEALLCGAVHFLVKGRESPFGFKFMVENVLARS